MMDCIPVPYSNYQMLVTSSIEARASLLVLQLCLQRYDEVGMVEGLARAIENNVSYLDQHLFDISVFVDACKVGGGPIGAKVEVDEDSAPED